ncbi:hypothetical protein EYF80_011419 [Liparis tanakae]|uniref:Uncharacterized protein n=1 Tax=Liparis tanakae TaxID=230148 RepID=A0A4Z2IKU8_9TELE|nr:hypothetical protein EYF80_011419 [Liparis tanakae]
MWRVLFRAESPQAAALDRLGHGVASIVDGLSCDCRKRCKQLSDNSRGLSRALGKEDAFVSTKGTRASSSPAGSGALKAHPAEDLSPARIWDSTRSAISRLPAQLLLIEVDDHLGTPGAGFAGRQQGHIVGVLPVGIHTVKTAPSYF